jgi:tetratricopeptide (TPR) repeat protein
MKAKVLLYLGEYDAALPLLESAQVRIVSTFGPISEAAALVASDLARVKVSAQFFDPEAAQRAVAAEVAVHDALGGEGNPYYATALWHLARLHMLCKRYNDADRCAARSLRLCIRHFGKTSQQFVRRLVQLADVYNAHGRVRPARKALERAVRLQDSAAYVDKAVYALALHELGKLDEREGNQAGARIRFMRALEFYTQAFPLDHPDVKQIRRCLEGASERKDNLHGTSTCGRLGTGTF